LFLTTSAAREEAFGGISRIHLTTVKARLGVKKAAGKIWARNSPKPWKAPKDERRKAPALPT